MCVFKAGSTVVGTDGHARKPAGLRMQLRKSTHTTDRDSLRTTDRDSLRTTDRDSLRYTCDGTRRVRQLALGCESS